MKNISQDRLALGIDIGGTKVSLGLITESGVILKKYRYPMYQMPIDKFLSDLKGYLDIVFEQSGNVDQIAGMGIGIKGMVDFANQVLIRSSILHTDSSYDICNKVSKMYGLPVVIDNDLNATTLAEARFGVGRVNQYFTYVNIGTGTAVGIVDSGKLVRGKNNFSGELGSFVCEKADMIPLLFNLESKASGDGFDQELRRLVNVYPQSILFEKIQAEGEKILSSEIFDSYHKGDLLSKIVVDNSLHILASAIINLEFLLNSQLYVFGGGVVADKWFFQKLISVVNDLCEQMDIKWTAKFQISELGASDAGLVGAASIFFES
jgi:glucokinase